MYYNFAATSTALYGNVTVEKAEPGNFKALEINTGDDYKMVQLDKEYGQFQFWNDIEEELASSDALRLCNLFTVTVVLSLAVIFFIRNGHSLHF